MSPADEIMDAAKVQEPSGGDSRLESSDLEDCQEVWIDELDDYILETQRRQTQVAQYFWANIIVSVYRHYSFRHLFIFLRNVILLLLWAFRDSTQPR
jgi:hypothetical protein